MKAATAAQRLLSLVALLLAITCHASAQRVDKQTVAVTEDHANPPRLGTVDVDGLGQAAQVEIADVRSHRASIFVPMESVRVKRYAETQLDGLKIHEPGEPTLLSGLVRSDRYRLRVSTSNGGELRLLPTIQTFLSPLLKPQPRGGAVEMDGSAEYLNVALGALLYSAPQRHLNDDIVVQLDPIPPTHGKRLEHRLPVVVTLEPERARAYWNNAPLNDSVVIHVDEDTAIPLGSLSIGSQWIGSDDFAHHVQLNVTLAASHGRIQLNSDKAIAQAREDVESSDFRVLEADDLLLQVSGSVRSINHHLARLEYEPIRNYNGPDTIVVSMAPASSAHSDLLPPLSASSDLLHVFLRPVADPIQLAWAESQSSVYDLVNLGTSQTLLPLRITDEDDQEQGDTDPAAMAFFKYQDYMRAEVVMSRQSGFTLHHSAVTAQNVTNATGSFVQLQFEGRSADLLAALRDVQIVPPRASINSAMTHPAVVVLRVAKVHAVNGSAYMPTELRLNVIQEPRGISAPTAYLPLAQQLVTGVEDHEIDVGQILDWNEIVWDDSADPDGKLVNITVGHGWIASNSSTVGLSVAQRNLLFVARSLRELRDALSHLRYLPDLNFAGDDALRIAIGDRKATCWLRVSPVNDAPTISLDDLSPVDDDGAPEQTPMLQWFVPRIRVDDPDANDILTLEVTVDDPRATLSLASLSGYPMPGLWIEGMAPISTSRGETFTVKRFRARGVPSVINRAFASASVIEIDPPYPETQRQANARLRVCVSDQVGATACQDQSVRFTELETLLVVPAVATRLPFLRAIPASELTGLNASMLPADAVLRLRLSALLGTFESAVEYNPSSATCGVTTEKRLATASTVRVVRELTGPVECLASLLARVIYRSSAAVTTETLDTITVEVWHARHKRVSTSFSVVLLPPSPRFVVSVSDGHSDTHSSRLWRWTSHQRALLSSFAAFSVNATGDFDSPTQDETYGPLLALNVTCSASCLISYLSTQTPLVPHVSFILASTEPARSQRFVGTQASLTQLLQTLEISATPVSTSATTRRDGKVEFTLVETDHSLYTTVTSSLRIPFQFELGEAPLRWLVRQAEYRVEAEGTSGVVTIDRVALATDSQDLSRDVHIVIVCEYDDASQDGVISISVDHASHRIIDRRCGPTQAIDLHGTLVEINAALAKVKAKSSRPADVRIRFAAIEDEVAAPIQTDVSVQFAVAAQPTAFSLARRLTHKLADAIVVNESSALRLGRVLTFAADDSAAALSHQLFQLVAVVTQGVLVVPLDEVCCVHIKSSINTTQLEVEGTMQSLQDMLSAVWYEPRVSFWGRDSLRLSIEDPSGGASHIEDSRWMSETAIRVVPVNDAPVVSLKRRSMKRLPDQSDGLNGVPVFQTELAITISDNDIENLPLTSDGEGKTPRADVDGSTVRVQLVAQDGVSAFVIPDWDALVHLTKEIDKTLATLHVDNQTSVPTNAMASLTFTASLTTANAILRSVLLRSSAVANSGSSCESAADGETTSLTIRVSDLGHGVIGWEAQEATEIVSSCDEPGDDDSVGVLSLSLPPEHASLDATKRTLTVSGLELKTSLSSSDISTDEDIVRVRGAAAFRVVPEVQRLRLVTPQRIQLLTVTIQASAGAAPLDMSAVSGTFELQVAGNPLKTTTVYAQAAAMRLNEVMGDEGTGRGLAESMEARLSVLYGDDLLKRRQIQVVKSLANDQRSVVWQIFVAVAPGDADIPLLSVGNSALAAAGAAAGAIAVFTTSQTYAGSLGGSFFLQLGGESTRAIPATATALTIQNVLEELTSLDVVHVTDVDAYSWDVTFFQPGANVPLLKANSSKLAPTGVLSDGAAPVVTSMGASAEVSRVTRGLGQGSLYEIDVSATPVSPVYGVRAASASSALGSGRFVLTFQSDATGAVLATTAEIAVDAVAMTQDEGTLRQQGGRVGSSLHSKLKAAIQQLPQEHWRSGNIQIVVTRSQTAAAPPAFAWTVTFVNAPADFPSLASGTTNSQPLANAVALTVTKITPSNSVGGFFTLSVGGLATPPMAATASAQEVQDKLNALRSVGHAVSPSTQFGRVVVRRREIRAVSGASFAVLFVEQVASTRLLGSTTLPSPLGSLVTADGGQLTGLGAFARVVTSVTSTAMAASDAAWIFPSFSSLGSQHTKPVWMNAVRADFHPSHFELEGTVSDIRPLLRQFSYALPTEWCCGRASVIVDCARTAARISTTESDTVTVRTDEQTLAFATPQQVQVTLRPANALASDIQDATATRGSTQSIGSLHLVVPAWSRVLLRVGIHVRVRYGFVSRESRDCSSLKCLPNDELWVNGTIAAVDARLGQLQYTSSPSSSHTVDVLSADVFASSDGETQYLAVGEFLIRMDEPPLEPRIVIQDGLLQGEGGAIVLIADDDKALAIPIFSIIDANQVVLRGDDIETVTLPQKAKAATVDLTLRADLGRLSFSNIDGLALRANSSRQLKLHGDITTVNGALQNLQYEQSDVFAHSRDTLTVQVQYHPMDRPVLTDSHTLRIQIRHVVHVPRVVIANDSIVAYASKEDNGYQFPRLTLEDDFTRSGDLRKERTAQRRPVVELRRTDLLPPSITTLKPASDTDDWRHRWVADFPGLSASITTASAFTVVGTGTSFFLTGSDQAHGEELWMSDGSSNGTRLFADLMPGDSSSTPSHFAILPSSTNKLVFAADGIDRSWALDTDKACNRERLSSTDSGIQYVAAKSATWDPSARYDCPQRGWRWATTAEASARFQRQRGVKATHDVNISEPYVFWDSCDWKGYTFGGSVRKYFRFADSGSTGALKHAGRRDSEPVEVSFATTDFAGIVCVQDQSSGTQAGRELWIADSSSPSSVKRLADLEVGPRGSNPRFLTAFQSKWLLFQATTGDLGTELYKTDGSSSGTTLVEDIWPGPRSASPSDFAEWTNGDGRMYFSATTDAGRELWSTDGLSSITTERGRRATPTTSGLLIGTALVRDVCAGASSSDPQFLAALGSLGVFFSATDCTNGRELWVTDGSVAGTKMVKDLNPTSGVGSDPSHLVAFSGKLYFAATVDSTRGRELFVSDGTSTGTKLLVELAGGVASAAPTTLTVANARLYFHALDGSGAASLWASDGSASGTTAVWDAIFQQSHRMAQLAAPTDSGGRSNRFFVFNNALYYFAESRRGLYASDDGAAATDDEFRLEISVSHGTLSLPSIDNSSFAAPSFISPSLAVEGSRRHIQDVLRRLLFHAPLNWNVLQTPTDHVVHWRFNVSSSSSAAPVSFRITTADLIVRPQPDPPVIIVPAALEHATDSARDYLSRLRLQCLPVTVREDEPTQLRGFSLRGVDDMDGTLSWELALSVGRGRLDIDDGAGCVKSSLLGQLRAAKRIRVVASRLSCLRRLLQSMVYTSDPHASGSDSLTIQVSALSATATTTSQGDQASVPIVIAEVNDAPYLTSRSGFYYEAIEDQALVLRDLVVVDPDVAVSDRITVDLRVRFGSIALLYFGLSSSSRSSSIVVVRNESSVASPPNASSRLVLSGALRDINAALSSVAYTSAKDWNSLAQIAHNASDEDGYDVISVELSDAQSFNASTSAALFVYVSPAPDPVVIWPPSVIATSVYAFSADGALHGDEDAWLETERLAFTTVDDTSRLSLDVSVRVGHGRLAFEKTTLQDVTVSGSASDGSSWRLRGRLDVVNRTIATLRYLPAADYYGTDALEIIASAVDVYASQQSITNTIVVPIQVHAVNDPPLWTLPSSTMRWTQDAPTRIAGVVLDDVDFHSVDCSVVQCELEVVVEATASGLLTFPRLKSLMRSPQFTVSASSTDATAYIVLTGSMKNLNSVLSEIVLTTTDADSLVREPVEIWFTADDKGTFGSGGTLVTRTKLTLLPFQWADHSVELVTPGDRVLATDEDTALLFPATIRLVDRDSSSRPAPNSPQYEVSVAQAHGSFRLATRSSWATTRLLVLPSTSDRALQFRGFLPQINAALNGSAYVPDANWFGSDEIHISVREIDSGIDSEPVTAVVSVFVVPVCDAPQWLKAPGNHSPVDAEPTDLELEEDGQALLSTVSIIDVDVVEGGAGETHRDVTVSVEVFDGGGVMLATTRGLRIQNEQPPMWTTPFESLRLLFFSRVTLTGRTSDLNAALRGLIYRPQPDFHTNGHVWDAIALTLTATAASCPQSEQDRGRLVVRARVHAVNDAPLVVSSRFTRVSQPHPTTADIRRLGVNVTQEALEDQELVLDAVTLSDVDMLFRVGAFEDGLTDADMKLRVSCLSCSVRPSLGTDTLQRDFGILTTRDDSTDSTQYFGSILSLNTALLQSLVFKGSPHFHGDAAVVLEVSDLGFFGRGGPLTTTFVMAVRVFSVNDGPQILIPPYGTREPPLRVDEQSSVLLRGAPNAPPKPTEDTQRHSQTPHQQLMFANPPGLDSTVRLRSLLEVETIRDSKNGVEPSGMSFYVSLSPEQLLFSAFRPDSGAELWTSDGTASGTRLLKDIAPGAFSSHPQYLTKFSATNRVYFGASGPNTDAWRLSPDYRDRCDGMRESVFAPGVVFVVAAQTSWDPSAVYDCPTGFEWMTTAEAQRVFVGTVQNDGHSAEPLVYYGQCGWQAYDWGGQQRTHFRFADSRTTGALKHVGHRDSYRPDVGFQTAAFAGVVCRKATSNEDASDAWSRELWATDGTAQGTVQVTRLGSSTLPAFITEYRSRLFFQATTLAFGTELWASDGSRDGTQLVADIAFGPRSSSPEQLTVANGKLFFSATTDAYGRELWLSDGEPRADFAQVDHGDVATRTGTRLVVDIRPGPDSSTPLHLVALPAAGLLLFQANDGVHGRELWVSDGTVAGTSLVLDIHTGPQSSTPQFLTHFNGRVFFQADDGTHGAELWTTDGSATNTKLLVDLSPGFGGANPRYLSVLSLQSGGPSLVFAASTDRDPQVAEFWVSDGTSGSGTRRLFASSRDTATLNERAMLALHKPQVVGLGGGFVYFGTKRPEPRRSREDDWMMDSRPPSVVSRSLTLVDDGALDSGTSYAMVLQCEHGLLSLTHQHACSRLLQAAPETSSARLELRGPLDHLNCLVTEVVYHATPSNASVRVSVDGWDDAIVVTLSEEPAGSAVDGRSYSATQRVSIHVVALNHAPVVELATRIFAPLGQWTALPATVSVSDEDAGGDAVLFVRLSARTGRLRLTDGDNTGDTAGDSVGDLVVLTPLADPHRGAVMVEFSATASRATAVLRQRVQYACLREDGCVDGTRDTLTLLVDDNGFSGSGGPQVTTKTASVLVLSG